jgi:hypothetical protein
LKIRKSGKDWENGKSGVGILALSEPIREAEPFRKTPFMIF